MEYAKSISSTKFYIGVIGSTLFIVFASEAITNTVTLGQATSVITLALSIILQALPFIFTLTDASSNLLIFLHSDY